MATSACSGFCKYLSNFFSIAGFLTHFIFHNVWGVTLNAFNVTPLVDGPLTCIKEVCVFKVSPRRKYYDWQPIHSFEFMVQHASFMYSSFSSKTFLWLYKVLVFITLIFHPVLCTSCPYLNYIGVAEHLHIICIHAIPNWLSWLFLFNYLADRQAHT